MKAFVIRLKGILTSESLAKDCIQSGLDNGLTINEFDGIYGRKSIDLYTKQLNVSPFKKKLKKGRLGVKGCFLSHYSLWLKSIELNEPLIIFEHDAVVLQPFPENLAEQFDEFLLLDPFNKFSKSYHLKHQEAITSEQKIVKYHNAESRKKYSIDTEYAMGLQGYIIKPSAAIKLKESISETGYYPADMQCNKGILNLQTVTSPLASINKKYYNNISLMSAESSTQYIWTRN